jgi:hypothetical protein
MIAPFRLLLLPLLLLLLAAAPLAASQRTIDMLVRGGPESQRQAAQDIYNGIERNPDVLDVLAEVLAQGYQRPGNMQVDATSWMCKALGASGQPRYRSLLRQIIDTATERKVRKYAQQSLEMLPSGEAEPYVPGTVDLNRLRDLPARVEQPPPPSKGDPGPATTARPGDFSVVRHGMSMEEVVDLIGPPTATTSRVTGKAWAPFYYGGDTARMFALYKGRGRIVFSNDSRYAPVWRVIEVVEDPRESGYP